MQYVTTCTHEIFLYLYELYCLYFIYFSDAFLLNSSFGELLFSLVYVNNFSVGAGITTLMSISDGLDPYFLCRKMEKTQFVKE